VRCADAEGDARSNDDHRGQSRRRQAGEADVLEAARSRGVGLSGLSEHRIRPGAPALLLGYGRIAGPAIDEGARALADSLRQ